MRRFWGSILLVAVAALMMSCGSEKGAATAAIQAAETAWSAARDNVMKILPDDAKSMDDAIAAAKASLDSGDAKAALAAAKDLPAKIEQLTAGLAAKEAELRGSWDAMSAGLPAMVADVQKKVDDVSKAKRLPAGLDQATFDGAKSSLANATQMWTEAQAAQQSGNLAEAVTKAMGVKDMLTQVMGALKMPVPEAMQS